MTRDAKREKQLQEQFPWQRSVYHTDYNAVLTHYKVLSCLEHAVGDSVLDLACGDGTLTKRFAEHFETVVGVDASSQHLAVARQKVPNAEFHESLIEDFSSNRSFTSVFLLDIIEHVVDPIAVLKKAASFLSPGGRLIAHVPNSEAVNRRIAVLMGTLESCYELSPFDINVAGHRRAYNSATLREDFERAGLTVISSGGIFYKMLSTPQMDWFLKNGLWDSGHGWGRTGMETAKNWKEEFCRACYEYGKEHPEDCNIIFCCASRQS